MENMVIKIKKRLFFSILFLMFLLSGCTEETNESEGNVYLESENICYYFGGTFAARVEDNKINMNELGSFNFEIYDGGAFVTNLNQVNLNEGDALLLYGLNNENINITNRIFDVVNFNIERFHTGSFCGVFISSEVKLKEENE